jgi:uncharacterized protein DUF927
MLDDKAKEFFRNVVPWPVEDRGRYNGYINLHWCFLKDGKKDGKPLWAGRAFQTQKGFFEFIDWASTRGNFRDFYFCTSQQSTALEGRNGALKAVRFAANAQALKAVWIDLDVAVPGKIAKEGRETKEYSSLAGAVQAVATFVPAANLPPPSALVGSGGGLHVYWISTIPLAPHEWQRYADGLRALASEHGLLCDGGCTIDSARILRVPNTFNYKTEPPRPTKVLSLGGSYDFSTQLSALLDVRAHTATVTNVHSTQTTPVIEGSIGPVAPAFLVAAGGRVESLSLGCEPDFPPLDPGPIFKGCLFLRDALATGGANHSEPLWNLALLCAAHLPNGKGFAHALSSGYPSYNAGETDEKFARKLRERDERGVGWPGCDTIHGAGSRLCTGCPHFAAHKSPLNLGTSLRGQSTQTSQEFSGSTNTEPTAQSESVSLSGSDTVAEYSPLPAGYTYNAAGVICVLQETKVKDGPSNWHEQPLFQAVITHAWMQHGPEVLNFITTMSKGRSGPVRIKPEDCVSNVDCCRLLHAQGAITEPEGKAYVGDFMSSWMGKLRAAKQAVESKPFGWEEDDTGRHGFYYGGWLFTDDGKTTSAAFPTDVMRETYAPHGTAAVWKEVCKLLTDLKRPDIDLILASSLAAPLMGIVGKYSVVISCYGNSGRSKSAGVTVANAVWGRPITAKATSSTSAKSFIKIMGELNSLPVYWDDIVEQDWPKAYEAFRQATEGKEGNKLKVTRELFKPGEWKSLMLMTSNDPFVDFIMTKDKNTDAGVVRVLEYECSPTPPPGTIEPGRLNHTDFDMQMDRLQHNYGCVGYEYAKLLGHHPERIEKLTVQLVHEMTALVQPADKERFWATAIGVLLAGAHMANILGAELDIPVLKDFLIEVFNRNRARLKKEDLQGGTRSRTQDAVSTYLKDFRSSGMWSEQLAAKGKIVNVLKYPEQGRAAQFQFAVTERKLRLSKSHLYRWMNERGGAVTSYVVSGLEKHFNAHYVKDAVLGGGTTASNTNETLIEIPVPPNSPFEPMMLSYSTGVIGAATAAPGAMASALAQASKDAALLAASLVQS